jgi:hypothetical protein
LQASKFAERLTREAGTDPAAQIKLGFRIALGREPDAEELATSTAFVRGAPRGLADFCQALMNLNEFVYRP